MIMATAQKKSYLLHFLHQTEINLPAHLYFGKESGIERGKLNYL